MKRDSRNPETTPERSRIMSAIRAKNTKPEMIVRKFLHAQGLRFRLYNRKMSGTPDIVLPKYHTAIFVHGCFWHGHQHCKHYKLPKSNTDFWKAKINRNIERDARKENELIEAGWRVMTIWECQTNDESLSKIVKTIKEAELAI